MDLSVFGTLSAWFGLLLAVDGIILAFIFGVARARDYFGSHRMIAVAAGIVAIGIQLVLTSVFIGFIFLKPFEVNPGVASLTPDCTGMESTLERLPVGSIRRDSAFFEYQSGAGLSCIRHQVRNLHANKLAHVVWRERNVLFLDLILPQCTPSECKWFEVRRPTSQHAVFDDSAISYGEQRGQYEETVSAYSVKPPVPPSPQTVRLSNSWILGARQVKDSPEELTTLIQGTVIDGDLNPVRLDLRLTSIVVRDAAGYVLKYKFTGTANDEPAYIWRPGSEAPSTATQILWQSAAGDRFYEELDNVYTSSLNITHPIVVRIPAYGVQIDEISELVVVRGGKRIVATLAPAYRPAQ